MKGTKPSGNVLKQDAALEWVGVPACEGFPAGAMQVSLTATTLLYMTYGTQNKCFFVSCV